MTRRVTASQERKEKRRKDKVTLLRRRITAAIIANSSNSKKLNRLHQIILLHQISLRIMQNSKRCSRGILASFSKCRKLSQNSWIMLRLL